MSPQRFYHAVAQQPVPETAAGVLATLIALLAAFWNVHVVVLIILVVGGGIMDLWAGARRVRLIERLGTDGEKYDKTRMEHGVDGKLFRLVFYLFFGASLDIIVVLGGQALDLGFTGSFRSLTPVTAAGLLYRFSQEFQSVVRNIETSPGGRDSVFPLFIKLVDVLRHRLIYPNKALPERRWTDRIASTDIARAKQILAEDDALTEALADHEPEGDQCSDENPPS